jgi:hypothetical protein
MKFIQPKTIIIPVLIAQIIFPLWPITVCVVVLGGLWAIDLAANLSKTVAKADSDEELRMLKSKVEALQMAVSIQHP